MDKRVRLECIEALKKEGPPIIIVAAVREAEAVANACKENGINVEAFCDTEKRKTFEKFCGLEVIHTPNLPTKYPDARFIIASHHIRDVDNQLTEMGYNEFYSALKLFENYNVGNYNHMVSKSFMESRITSYKKTHEAYFDDSKLYMRSVDIMVTTKCSMKCESCSNLMQYYKNPQDSDHIRTLESLEILSKHVDDISEYRIIGGEPLMNKNWSKIVDVIIEKNPKRKVYVYTNGTIAPKEGQLKNFDGKDVNFIITDYGKLSRNVNKLTEILDKNDITYVRTPAENWLECGTIKHHKRSVKDLKEVFKQCCVKYVYTLLDGKLYRCPFIANANNLKAIPDNPSNYVDLFSKRDDVEQQLKKLMQVAKFFPGCDFCVGRPYDPTSKLGYDGIGMITPAKQAENIIKYKEFK
jgi:organic radical activating enzyme